MSRGSSHLDKHFRPTPCSTGYLWAGTTGTRGLVPFRAPHRVLDSGISSSLSTEPFSLRGSRTPYPPLFCFRSDHVKFSVVYIPSRCPARVRAPFSRVGAPHLVLLYAPRPRRRTPTILVLTFLHPLRGSLLPVAPHACQPLVHVVRLRGPWSSEQCKAPSSLVQASTLTIALEVFARSPWIFCCVRHLRTVQAVQTYLHRQRPRS
jgi:hypothetical protein